tara:strand:- start:3036 stop:4799 length:1764 start_codon:yes stop_codon:yes gene_type:complete
MNLKEIRKAMFAQADWSPNQSPEAISRTNSFINRAYSQLMLEAPFLFFESEVHLATEPDVSSKTASDTVKIIADNNTFSPGANNRDPWTWETAYTSTEVTANPDTYTAWEYDRSWDGRMIEITLADGTKVTNQIRTVWWDTDDKTYKFTLVQPWDAATNGYGNFKYRIYTEEYALPDDLIEVKSGTLRHVSNNYPLSVMGQDQAERLQIVSPATTVNSGIPRTMFRRKHLNLMNPASAPVAVPATTVSPQGAVTVHTDWRGPEPPGEFEYVVTYTWGKRDVEFRLPGLAHYRGYAQGWENLSGSTLPTNRSTTFASEPTLDSTVFDAAANRYREPRYESAPSPASEKVKVERVALSTDGFGVPAVKIYIPNIEYALGFMVKGSTFNRQSLHQSGIHVRIYRKRLSADFVGYDGISNPVKNAAGDITLHTMDIPDAFFLLAEFRLDETNKGVFYDNGEIIPDYSRRLRDTHGYQTFGLYPVPDKRYTVDLRCVRRPDELEDDSDTPLIHAEAMNVLISRALVYLYESMGNHDVALLSQERYDRELLALSKRYGDLRPAATPVLRRLSRARYSRRGSDFYRKWYDSSST